MMTHHTLDAFRAIRRSPYQSLAAILTLTQTFFLAYVFVILMIGSEVVLRYFETQPQISAFFKPDVTDEKVADAQNQIQQKEYVKSVKRVTKQDALSTYREDNKNDPLLLQLVTADILPASLEVSAKDIQSLPQLEHDLKALPGIDEVVFQKNVTDTLAKWTHNLRSGGIFLVSLMALTSVIQMMVMTSMKISAKRGAIKTMQLIGASRWYIKSPFILEGSIYGISAAVLGWLATYVSILYLTPWLLGFLGDIPLLPVSPLFMFALLGGGTIVGITIGAFSSLFAAQHFLHKD
ncbi:MAG: permease-like cell division protein FtsX [Patescibacteria group bacterium]